MILISPLAEVIRPLVTTSGDLSYYLKERAPELNVQEAADATIWAANTGGEVDELHSFKRVAKLPKGSKVTLFYMKGDREVDDLERDLNLEPKGVTLTSRWTKSRSLNVESLVDEVWQLIEAKDKPVEEEEEEVDDTL